MVLLRAQHVSKIEKGEYTVKDISFTQASFQKMAIAGETGSGKTTLLKLIAGLLQPDEGQILFEDKRVKGPNDQLIPGHKGIAYLSQHFELRNNYWVHEILSYANELSEDDANRLYQICRIDHLLQRRTDQLSGGERQRIALTRLLIGAPRLLLLDEPFSHLDTAHKRIIKSVIDDITQKLKITCILVSHDATDVLPWADSIVVIKNGEFVQQADPETIYRQPADLYCAGLFGEYNFLSGKETIALNYASPPGNKRLLVRPEQLVVQKDGGVEATVQSISFMGSHYRMRVLLGNLPLLVKTTIGPFAVGDTIGISLTAFEPCYL
ncbi:MAG: ABC transporter ATP-binding protein [Chitinophagaceae bacterium]